MALVEPVEINAGRYYLRTLRADDRIDDRPAVLAAFGDPDTARWIPDYHVRTLDDATAYIARRHREWLADQRCSWAVADPTTGDMLAEVGLKNLDLSRGEAAVACWTHPSHRGLGIAAHAVDTALRFGFEALGLRHIEYSYAEANAASARVADKCGFTTLVAVLPDATELDGRPHTLIRRARHSP